RDLAFMGFIEVVRNLPTILGNLRFCKEDISLFKPDTLILIDYPGFNLRIAEWAKQQGLKVIYYISPQVWAWKEGRVRKMKQHIDKMLVILPFEKDYFRDKWNWEVEYVGHPLVEVIDAFRAKQGEHRSKDKPAGLPGVMPRILSQDITDNSPAVPNDGLPVIALLPGSRKQEILKKLPIMLELAGQFPGYRFVVAKAPGQEDSFYQPLLEPHANVSSVRNETYKLLSQSEAALVTSGTATLETALFGVPEIVCYKGSSISYQIAKRLIKVKYICLVNLIMDKPVVKELIQDDLTVENLRRELTALLNDKERRAVLAKDYQDLKKLLSQGGHASANAAESIVRFLS
ncbi:MAG: lipid-A-disaccharide synthase, partial [Bacteroidetes bacterium]|nr:lipid-A-disaccharide synthase [Bacteroidota bacterium]